MADVLRETSNPLLDAWKNAPRDQYGYVEYHDRTEAIQRYSFAIPNDEALDLIVSYGPVVEIGAGTGYWASLLRDRGCDVAAFDIMGEDHQQWFPHGLYGGVQYGGIEKAAVYADRTLLLVWPYMDSMAIDALVLYEEGGGKRLVYVGEGRHGCTANKEFFDRLDKKWMPRTWVEIPQWSGIHDSLELWERR